MYGNYYVTKLEEFDKYCETEKGFMRAPMLCTNNPRYTVDFYKAKYSRWSPEIYGTKQRDEHTKPIANKRQRSIPTEQPEAQEDDDSWQEEGDRARRRQNYLEKQAVSKLPRPNESNQCHDDPMNEDSNQPPVKNAYHPESVDNPLDHIPDGFTPMHVLEENQRRHDETFGADDESNAHTLHEQMAKLMYSHGGDMSEIEENTILEALLKDCAHAKVMELSLIHI